MNDRDKKLYQDVRAWAENTATTVYKKYSDRGEMLDEVRDSLIWIMPASIDEMQYTLESIDWFRPWLVADVVKQTKDNFEASHSEAEMTRLALASVIFQMTEEVLDQIMSVKA